MRVLSQHQFSAEQIEPVAIHTFPFPSPKTSTDRYTHFHYKEASAINPSAISACFCPCYARFASSGGRATFCWPGHAKKCAKKASLKVSNKLGVSLKVAVSEIP